MITSNRIEDLQNDEVVSIEPIPAAAPPPTKKTALEKLLGDEELESSAHEVDAHFSEKIVARNTNSLLWCRGKTSNFPHNSPYCEKVLVNTLTSTPSERLFSKAGLIVNKLRSNLRPNNVNTFLNCNKNFGVKSKD